MNALLLFLLLIPASYLVGTVPWGLLIGKWSHGVDVRTLGSGNFGMQRVITTGRKVFFRRLKLRSEVAMRLEDGTLVCSGIVSGMGVPK